MNKVIMIGNLTKDPEVRTTQTGKKVASFSIAVNEGKDRVQYFNCSAWERLADILEQYVKKGTKVAIVGGLQNRSWDKPDGSKGYATDITVRELDILTSRADQDRINQVNTQNPGSQPAASQSASDTAAPAETPAAAPEKLPEINVDDLNVQMPF